jgi:bacterioferritin
MEVVLNMKNKKPAGSSRVIDLLNRSLSLEYSIIIHMPRVASSIKDQETRALVLLLGSVSIKHADTVAGAISMLGGHPDWSFEPPPVGDDLIDVFRKQLEKERLAQKLHRETAGLVNDKDFKMKFEQMARDEEGHIKIVNDILSKLEQDQAGST